MTMEGLRAPFRILLFSLRVEICHGEKDLEQSSTPRRVAFFFRSHFCKIKM